MTEQQQDLVLSHRHIAWYASRKYIYPNQNAEDLFQIACLGLCQAAIYYDGSVRFSTFAEVLVNNNIKTYLRSQYHITRNESLVPDPLPDLIDMQEQMRLWEALQWLTDQKSLHGKSVSKGIDCIMLRLNGESDSDIAKYFGVAECNIRQWIARARQKLKQEKHVFRDCG